MNVLSEHKKQNAPVLVFVSKAKTIVKNCLELGMKHKNKTRCLIMEWI